MDGTHRQPASDLMARSACMETLGKHAPEFSFFRVVELMLEAHGLEVEERALERQALSDIIFRTNPGIGFPASDVASVSTLQSASGREEATVIEVNFLGLHGSSSPLPSHLLETAVWSQGEEGVQQAFNDFFSNRLIWLFYLTWRKYRYYVRFRPGASDQFSDWMFALIGFGGREARSETNIPWAKLLTYLGVIAGRTRSAEMIAGVIAHAFALPDVTVRQLEERKVAIAPDQKASAGRTNMVLGHSFTIGDTISDVAGKFTLVLRELSFERFRDFLPSGRDYPRLKELVEFLLRDPLAYDVELHFASGQRPVFALGQRDGSELGWTTFSGNNTQEGLDPVVLQVRT